MTKMTKSYSPTYLSIAIIFLTGCTSLSGGGLWQNDITIRLGATGAPEAVYHSIKKDQSQGLDSAKQPSAILLLLHPTPKEEVLARQLSVQLVQNGQWADSGYLSIEDSMANCSSLTAALSELLSKSARNFEGSAEVCRQPVLLIGDPAISCLGSLAKVKVALSIVNPSPLSLEKIELILGKNYAPLMIWSDSEQTSQVWQQAYAARNVASWQYPTELITKLELYKQFEFCKP